MIRYEILTPSSELWTSPALASFFEQAYGDRCAYKYPRRCFWLYGRSGALAVVAWCDSRIVGWVGAMPIEIRRQDRCIRAAWSVDNFVLTSYRSRGIGTSLQRQAEGAVPFTLSTWISTANFRIKEHLKNRHLSTISVLATMTRPTLVHKYDVSEPDPEEIATLAYSHLNRYDCAVVRDASYCRWRFKNQPNSAYVQLRADCGLVLVRKCGPKRPCVGMIGDVFPIRSEPTEFVALVGAGAHYLMMNECTVVRYGTTDLSQAAGLIGDGWEVCNRYPVLVSADGGSLDSCETFLFGLSDSDFDQYPW